MEFPCYQCGKCCSNVHLSERTKYLDAGNGVCKHFNFDTKLCNIYTTRPSICNISLQYKKVYSQYYSWDDFVELNLIACAKL